MERRTTLPSGTKIHVKHLALWINTVVVITIDAILVVVMMGSGAYEG